ncbi:recombinase family protein [Amycolatopsis vancoresmycina]|uniref:Resolvase/invertase-type recombinase catalytic domain-containing protein n=1 Tax=Amycolatopsis vancoresmycina DSM 44592 TaxID=1292037 RepID=R1GDM6_9PSEU|nr:recombinase family protein [Amycolatopsis vancoresmycina]EOD69363.1 hypothetical protein H480_06553 [Amycolatopsis vancoresmycina DSM 44592]
MPLAYGYLRVPADAPDHQVKALEDQLMDYADQQGCTFAGFYFEFNGGMTTAIDDLIEELRRTRAPYVIVPSLRHVAYNRLLQEIRLCRLEFETGAQVLTLGEKSPVIAPPATGVRICPHGGTEPGFDDACSDLLN